MSREMAKVSGAAGSAGSAAGDRFSSSFNAKIKALGKTAALGLSAAFAGVVGFGVKTAAEFEQTQISLETLMGSSRRAKKEMKWLTEKSAATPFELADLAKADKTLLGFGFSSDKVRKQFLLNMGDMAAAVGLPSSRVPDLARVFGQINASGRASLEDINQLIDAGIPVWDALEKQTGKSVKSIRKDISDGKLSADEFFKAMNTQADGKFAGAMEKQSQTLAGLWSSLKDNAAIAAMNMVKPFVPLIKNIMPRFSELTETAGQKVADFAKWFKKDALPALQDFGDYVRDNILPVFSGIGDGGGEFIKVFKSIGDFVGGLLPIFKQFGESFLNVAGPAFEKIGGLITDELLPAFRDILPVIQPVVGFLLKVLGSTLIGLFQGVVKIISGVIKVITGIFKTLKAVITGDWSAAWEGLKQILSGVLDAIVGVIQVWFNWGIFAIFKNGLKQLIKIFKSPIQSLIGIFKKVMTGIDKAAGAMVRAVGPIFKTLASVIGKILIGAVKVLGKVVATVFKAIWSVIKFAWNNGIKPILTLWWKYITKVLVPILKFLWQKVVVPVFRGIGNVIKFAWNNVIKPVFVALKDFIVQKVVPAFRSGVDKIKGIWDGLKRAAAVPVNFLIGTVYNNGLRKMLNLIPGVDLPAAKLVSWGSSRSAGPSMYTGDRRGYAFGGRVFGSGTETSDSIPALLSKNEFVIRARQAKKHYKLLEAINNGTDFRYARGGRVWPVPGRDTSTYGGHDGVDINRGSGWDDYGDPIWAAAPGTVSYVGTGRGYGLATFIRGSYGELVYGHMSKAYGRSGMNVNAGALIGRVGNTGNSSAPHLHFGFPGGTYGAALAFLNGASVKGGSGTPVMSPKEQAKQQWYDILTDGPGIAKAIVRSITSGLGNFGMSGMFKDAAIAIFRRAVNWIDDKIPNKWLPDTPLASALKTFGIFDDGGVLNGRGGVAMNLSGKPERVLDPRTTDNFERLTNALDRRGRGRTSERVALTITNWDTGEGYMETIAERVVDDALEYEDQMKRMR